MDSGRRPGAFSPMFQSASTSTPPSPRSRSMSIDSNSSTASSQAAMMAGMSAAASSGAAKRGPTPTQQQQQQQHHLLHHHHQQHSSSVSGPQASRPIANSIYASPRSNSSTPVLQNYSRPTIAHVVNDGPQRKNSPLHPGAIDTRLDLNRNHKRHNSQGFFEPSLPTLTDVTPTTPTASNGGGNTVGLTPSQIAAQAAMQSQNNAGGPGPQGHFMKRAQTVPSPPLSVSETGGGGGGGGGRPRPTQQMGLPSQPQMTPTSSRKGSLSATNVLAPPGNNTGPGGGAAAGAASAAYAVAGQLSPGLTTFSDPAVDRTPRSKAERAKQIFSKSKQISVPNARDFDSKDPRSGPVTAKIPSPGSSVFPKGVNASMASLNDNTVPASSSSSIYGMANSSTSTLVPLERMKSDESVPQVKEKEKPHRTHLFSRPKKIKEKFEEPPIALSSASSNSKPVDPSAPQSIYSFAQSSPAPSQTAFGKTMTGLDLRHGRNKKKEEFDFNSTFGQPATATGHFIGGTPVGYESASSALQGFGLHNMSSEDAWDFLKAKILVIFEGEELKIPVEDLNRLVSVHIQRCIQRRTPVIVEDLRDLLNTGFASLDMTIRRLQEDRLVPQLVDMWLSVFGVILPYMQAVFLPLDLELRGHGTMTPSDAAEFWGLSQDSSDPAAGPSEAMDVRKCVLLSFRDNIILPRHDALKQVFSRLSLESINVGLDSPLPPPNPSFGSGFGSSGGSSGSGRPDTATSLDPGQSSFNSQGSTLISHTDSSRSRATSNTSAPELPTFSPTQAQRPHAGSNLSSQGGQLPLGAIAQYQHRQPDSSQVTETVGRVLQFMSVLVSLHSDDEAQEMMEDLTKTLKLNWLGRGRTGRNRKGLVGARVPRRATPVVG